VELRIITKCRSGLPTSITDNETWIPWKRSIQFYPLRHYRPVRGLILTKCRGFSDPSQEGGEFPYMWDQTIPSLYRPPPPKLKGYGKILQRLIPFRCCILYGHRLRNTKFIIIYFDKKHIKDNEYCKTETFHRFRDFPNSYFLCGPVIDVNSF
jgi:hypothetical protein